MSDVLHPNFGGSPHTSGGTPSLGPAPDKTVEADPDSRMFAGTPFEAIANAVEMDEDGTGWQGQVTLFREDGDFLPECAIEFSAKGRKKFTALFLTQFGFGRLPQTWAELNGMLSYCQRLHGLSGGGIVENPTLSAKQAKALAQQAREAGLAICRPEYVKALRAFCQGDELGLRREHTDALIAMLAETWADEYRAELGDDRYMLPGESGLGLVRCETPITKVSDFGEARQLREAHKLVSDHILEAGVTVGQAMRLLAGEDSGLGATTEMRHRWAGLLLRMGISCSFAFSRQSGVWGAVHCPELLVLRLPELAPHMSVLSKLAFKVEPGE